MEAKPGDPKTRGIENFDSFFFFWLCRRTRTHPARAMKFRIKRRLEWVHHLAPKQIQHPPPSKLRRAPVFGTRVAYFFQNVLRMAAQLYPNVRWCTAAKLQQYSAHGNGNGNGNGHGLKPSIILHLYLCVCACVYVCMARDTSVIPSVGD
jgi:hypothetical protein